MVDLEVRVAVEQALCAIVPGTNASCSIISDQLRLLRVRCRTAAAALERRSVSSHATSFEPTGPVSATAPAWQNVLLNENRAIAGKVGHGNICFTYLKAKDVGNRGDDIVNDGSNADQRIPQTFGQQLR